MSQQRKPRHHLPTATAEGIAYRFVKLKYAHDPISGIGALNSPGRYHIEGGFRALYASESPLAALKETEFLVKSEQDVIFKPAPPMVLFALEYNLEYTLDLRDKDTQAALGVNREQLFGAWLRGTPTNPRPTQKLALAAFEDGVQALFVPTAGPSHEATNLVVFPDNLTVGGSSWVQVSDPERAHTYRIP